MTTPADARTVTLCELRAARRLGLTPTVFVEQCFALWGRSFEAERARRAGSDAKAQRKGHASRQLESELARHIHDEGVARVPSVPPIYGSLAWHEVEVRKLRASKVSLESQCAGLHARCRMLTEYMQAQGVRLDESAMREAHVQQTADRIDREYRLQMLEDFHGDVARIIQRANATQAANPDPARTALINALESATARRRRRMSLSVMDAARTEAGRQVARIPFDADGPAPRGAA